MAPGADIVRFASTAILLKHPVLVTLTIVFVLGLLSTQYVPGGTSSGGIGPWIGLALLLIICAAAAWLLCSSEEVELDLAARRVTQRHLFLKFETAKNQWDFSNFNGVCVEQVTSKEQSAATSPGSGGYQSATKTTYSHSYKVSLLRPDIVVNLPDKQISAPSSPLELPMEKQDNPLPLEAIAQKLSTLGGWPATRRGYVLVTSAASGDTQVPSSVRVAPSASETAIDAD